MFWDHPFDRNSKEDMRLDRNAELERMRKEALPEMYTCVCEGCYYTIRVEQEKLHPYIAQSAMCPECGELPPVGWNVVRSLAWSGNAFERQIELFEYGWTKWLNSDEGKLAQEKAQWNL